MRNAECGMRNAELCIPHSSTLLALLFFLPIIAACGSDPNPLPPAAPNTYRIVSSLPSKGEYAHEARLMKQAIDLAVEEAGARGIRLEHIALDGGDPESGAPTRAVETSNAQRAVDDPSVVAYIGPWTSQATGWSLPITSKAGLLHMGVTATWPGLTQEGWDAGEPEKYYWEGKRNYVRLIAPDSWQGRAAAEWMRFVGIEYAQAIEDGSSYSQGIAREFLNEWRTLQPQDKSDSISLETYLDTQLPPSVPSKRAFFFAASTVENAILLSRAVSQKESNAQIFFTDTAMRASMAEEMGNEHNRWNRFVIYNGTTTLEESETVALMNNLYISRYGEPLTPVAARAMGSVEVIRWSLLQRANILGENNVWSREGVRDAVVRGTPLKGHRAPLVNFKLPGAFSVISFTESGDNLASALEGYVITNSEFRFVRRLLWPSLQSLP